MKEYVWVVTQKDVAGKINIVICKCATACYQVIEKALKNFDEETANCLLKELKEEYEYLASTQGESFEIGLSVTAEPIFTVFKTELIKTDNYGRI